MTKTFEQGKDEVAKLCRYFATNREAFLAPGVKEAHVRQSLIDPFFEALGWDVRNTAMLAPQNREVIPEDSLEVEGQQKAPDYTFRFGRLPMFYAEAKKCGVNINADPGPAYQLRRYGWSAKVAVSILTDFEELGVYDCTLRPRQSDKASRARIQYFTFHEYPDRWRELWDVFSREAVWSGAFDQYAASKRKRGTSEVDVEFLKEIEGWRDALAHNIALRNKNLSSDDLNAAVQLTIDRVVFLRMGEDRGLEPYEQLLNLCERPDLYARFMRDLCRRADQKYNSGLFHFQKEAGVSDPPDRTTPGLAVDDKVFKPIIQSLYFAHGSPYHFGVLPVEILGTVYERFLGKVIRLTGGHQARIEEKPEVRKAGGVYYTPAYIVDYIVKQTVGRQIAGRSPAQLAGRNGKGQPYRVLDMACGSGSFLLGAYQCLLDHCLKWYIDHKPQANRKAVYKDPRNGHWRLTIAEKKRILTTHIFGVDIDPQAVEVTKLSLLLKVLEGETDQSLHLGLLPFSDRALPNLADNIKCGNSLIGPDYFTGKLIAEPDEMKRVNPFDWAQAFREAMKAGSPRAQSSGGFDCIIGNPPYIRIQTMKETAPLEVEIYKELYQTAREGNYDIYVVFIEQGLKLLNAKGQLGFICPHKFFNAKYGKPVRTIIARGKHLAHVVHFGDQQVFDGATTYTCLLFLDKAGAGACQFVQVRNLVKWKSPENGITGLNGEHGVAEGMLPAALVTASEWNFHVGDGAALFRKLSRMKPRLGDVAHIFVGLQTSADPVFILDRVRETKSTLVAHSTALDREVELERDICKPLLKGGDIHRFAPPKAGLVLIFPYHLSEGRVSPLREQEVKRLYPKTYRYLLENKEALLNRKDCVTPSWFLYVYPKNLARFAVPKIMTGVLALRGAFTYDSEGGSYFVGGGNAGGYGIAIKPGIAEDRRYVLGLLNSRLLDFCAKRVSTGFRGGYFSYARRFIEQLPIRLIDFNENKDKAAHDRMVNLVDSMLDLHRKLSAAKSAAQKDIIQRQVDATDREIDRLVYDLYGLTKEEIAIVEGTSAVES